MDPHSYVTLSWYLRHHVRTGQDVHLIRLVLLCCQLDPVSGPVEGGTVVTISGSNLGQRAEDIQNSVTVAGIPCSVIHSRYEVSSRQVIGTPELKLLARFFIFSQLLEV